MTFISSLTFVKKHHEHNDVYTFYFSTKKKLDHKAGQHGVFLLPGLYRPHPFSLSSAPEEELVMFTTDISSGSPFKKKLLSMQAGEKMYLFGPMLNFTFVKYETKYVFLAQGIGITPFRSMLVHAHNKQLPITTTLIHVDRKDHTFKELTQQYATTSYYPKSSDEFREIVRQQDVNQIFYLSGSPKFVSTTKKLLVECGVASSAIKRDFFFGY